MAPGSNPQSLRRRGRRAKTRPAAACPTRTHSQVCAHTHTKKKGTCPHTKRSKPQHDPDAPASDHAQEAWGSPHASEAHKLLPNPHTSTSDPQMTDIQDIEQEMEPLEFDVMSQITITFTPTDRSFVWLSPSRSFARARYNFIVISDTSMSCIMASWMLIRTSVLCMFILRSLLFSLLPRDRFESARGILAAQKFSRTLLLYYY